jgi:hypothetical protein
MSNSSQTSSGIKRPRTDQVLNYSDVLTSPKAHNHHVRSHAEDDGNEVYRDDDSMQATEQTSPTGSIEETELFMLDPVMLAWYVASELQAQYLMNYLQAQHCYGNTYVQDALVQLETGLQHRMIEMSHLNETNRQQDDEISQLKIQNKGLIDLNERLEKDNQRIPELQVFAVDLVHPPLPILTARLFTDHSTRNTGQL